MRNVLLITMFLASCANVNQDLECEIQSNGFIDGVDGEVKMGNSSAIEVFNEMDKAWAELDYEKIKTFVEEDAVMSFADGGKVTGPDEFVEYIKNEKNINFIHASSSRGVIETQLIKDYYLKRIRQVKRIF